MPEDCKAVSQWSSNGHDSAGKCGVAKVLCTCSNITVWRFYFDRKSLEWHHCFWSFFLAYRVHETPTHCPAGKLRGTQIIGQVDKHQFDIIGSFLFCVDPWLNAISMTVNRAHSLDDRIVVFHYKCHSCHRFTIYLGLTVNLSLCSMLNHTMSTYFESQDQSTDQLNWCHIFMLPFNKVYSPIFLVAKSNFSSEASFLLDFSRPAILMIFTSPARSINISLTILNESGRVKFEFKQGHKTARSTSIPVRQRRFWTTSSVAGETDWHIQIIQLNSSRFWHKHTVKMGWTIAHIKSILQF